MVHCRLVCSDPPRPVHFARKLRLAVAFAWSAVVFMPDGLRGQTQAELDLTGLTLEELSDLQVSTLTRRAQSVHKTAAAITVVTADEMRRTGLLEVPEALRLVPGFQVQRSIFDGWSISARGFADPFATKLLVLLDGRNVYTPFFAGVYWNEFALFPEDLDRIEVIRGPGASLWGANAVNGIVNVATKSAKNTLGSLASVSVESASTGKWAARRGERISDTLWIRVEAAGYEQALTLDELQSSGRETSYWGVRGGLRLDWEPTRDDDFVFQLNGATRRSAVEAFPARALPPISFKDDTQDVRVRWERRLDLDRGFTVQAYADASDRSAFPIPALIGAGNNIDLDTQLRWGTAGRHQFLTGVNWRRIDRQTEFANFVAVQQPRRISHVFSGFVQDDITVVPDRFTVTLGSKIEKHGDDDLEFLPTVRALWSVTPKHILWAAVSRAIRSPSDVERDVYLPFDSQFEGGLPTISVLVGNPAFDRETLRAYEAGFRFVPSATTSFEVAGYINEYDHLRSLRTEITTATFPFPARYRTFTFTNEANARAQGVEVSAKTRPADRLTLTATYTWQKLEISGNRPPLQLEPSSAVPRHQGSIRANVNLPHDWELDVSLFYVDPLKGVGVDRYWRADVRLGWRPTHALELSAGVQNLLDPEHREAPMTYERASTEVPRSVFGKVTWRF